MDGRFEELRTALLGRRAATQSDARAAAVEEWEQAEVARGVVPTEDVPELVEGMLKDALEMAFPGQRVRVTAEDRDTGRRKTWTAVKGSGFGSGSGQDRVEVEEDEREAERREAAVRWIRKELEG